MPATLEDFDKLLDLTGVEFAPSDPSAPIGPAIPTRGPSQGTAFGPSQGTQFTPRPPPEPPPEQGEFSKGVASGVEQVQALGYGGGAALMDIAGLDVARDSLIEGYLEHMTAAEQYAPNVEGVESIDSIGKFFDWAVFNTGEQLPTIISIVASGGAGGLIAKVAGKKGIEKGAAKLLQDRVKKFTADEATKLATRKVVGAGATTGAFLGASTLETGGILGEQVESGLEPRGGVALAGGLPAGALEIAVPLGLAKMFGLTGPLSNSLFARIRDAATSRTARGLALGTGAAVGEATTESLQEAIAIAARSFVDDNYDALGPESRSRILNSAATGGLLGFIFGGAGGAISSGREGGAATGADAAEATLLGDLTEPDSTPLPPTTPPPPTTPRGGEEVTPATPTPTATPEILQPSFGAPLSAQEAIDELIMPDETLAALERQRNRTTLSLPDTQAAQADAVTTTPIKITGLTSSDVTPLTMIDTVDINIPQAPEVTIEQTLARSAIDLLKIEQAEIKEAPASYTKKGNLRAPQQRRLLQIDDELVRLSAEGAVATPRLQSEALVTADNKEDLSRLKPGQRTVYNRLIDKIDEGKTLNDRESTMLDNLTSIIQQDPLQRETLPDARKTELIKDLETAAQQEIERSAREIVQKKRINKAIREYEAGDFTVEEAAQSGQEDPFDALVRTIEGFQSESQPQAAGTNQPTGQRITAEEARAGIGPVRLLDEGTVILLPSSTHIRDPRVKAALDKTDQGTRDGGQFVTQGLHVENADGSQVTFLLLDRIPTAERAAALYLHEVLVHHGLRTLPPAQKKAIINLLKKHRQPELELIAEQRGIELKGNEDIIAEELLAEFAENNDFQQNVFNRIVAIIRQWVRKLLPNWDLNLSDNDVRFILAGLQRKLQRAPARVAQIPTLDQLEANLGFPPSAAKNVTTKFLKQLHSPKVQGMLHKGTLTQGQYRSLAKRFTGSAQERDLILKVLDSYTALRLSPSEVEQAILNELILFDHYVDTQAQFVDYSATDASNYTRLIQSRELESEVQPQFVVYTDLRKDVEFTSGHYMTEPYYRGHVRGLALLDKKGNKSEFINIETQSDFAQTIARMQNVSEQEIKTAMAIDAMANSFHSATPADDSLTGILKALEGAKSIAEQRFGVRIPQETIIRIYPDLETGLDFANTVDHIFLAENRNLVNTHLMLGGSTDGTINPEILSESQKVYQQIGPTIFKRLIREDLQRAANAGYPQYSFAHPDEVATVEGWDGANLGHQRLYNRYQNLYKWFKQEYKAREVTETGFAGAPLRRLVADVKPGKDIIALAGGRTIPGRQATRLGADKEMADALDKLHNPLWVKMKHIFLTPLQIARGLKVKPLDDYMERLTSWAADKGAIISAADQILKDTHKLLNKREQATLARIMFSLTAKAGDKARALLPSERAAIYRQAGLQWSEVDADKSNIQVMQERYAEMLDNVSLEMQEAAMYQVMYRIVKRGKQFPSAEAERIARDMVDKYNDTDAFTPAREDIIEEITLLASPQDNQDTIAFLDDALVQLASLKDQYENMRGKNYFPYKRFGKWAVILRARKDDAEFEGRKFKKDETAGLWTFENEPDQLSWLNRDDLVKLHHGGNFDLEAFKMSELEESHVDIPPGFLDSVKKILNLDKDQESKLDKYALQFTPGSKFVAHMMKRRGISGMSMDMERTFATYMQSSANHIARVNHASRMVELQADAITQLKDAERAQPRSISGTNVTGISQLEEDLKRHFQYIMEPGNELAWLRSLGFTWYLGFNIKSSIVNLTQLPMVTLPYLGTKYGNSKAFAAMMKAVPDSTAFAQKNAKPLEPWLDKMIARGTRELFLDESLGVELAGAAQGDIMSRVLPANPATRAIHRIGHLASLPFQFTEKITRRVAFIAAARLHLEGVPNPTEAQQEEAFIAARDAVRETIFEYQKWNRPRFMRGKTSSIFLFWTFMQHMLVTLGGGYGKGQAAKVWGMLFMAAGMMGLPLAENILDLLDWGSTKAKKVMGLKNPYTDSRLAMREFFKDLPGGADLWMYGFSSRGGLGPLHVLDLLGAPIPQVDVQGSVGLGRPIPGLEEVMGRARSTEERFGRTVVDILGPVAGIFFNMTKAVGDDNPDTWKRFERALPASLKSVSKASRIITRGEETFRRGGSVIDYDPNDMEHNLEMIAQYFGFTPTRLNDRYKLRAHQEDMRAFYMTYRQILLEGLNYARYTNDPEGIADAKRAIRRFNSQVPDPRLRLGPKTLRRSQKQSRSRAELREEGRAFEKGLRRPFKDIAATFPSDVLP